MDTAYDFKRLGEYTVLLTWSYSWIEIDTFLIKGLESEDYQPNDMLGSLLAHRIYQFSFMTPRVLDKSSGVHGPFLINRLKSSDFTPIADKQFRARIDDIFIESGYNWSPEDVVEHNLIRDEAYWLLDSLPKNGMDYFELSINYKDTKYHHDASPVIDMFYEFILVNRVKKELFICTIITD